MMRRRRRRLTVRLLHLRRQTMEKTMKIITMETMDRVKFELQLLFKREIL